MKNNIVSIIVPVYNVKPYICKCLDSIIVQTYQDWECILVDDGSTDGSGAICDEYAKNDSRFVVVHKQKEGVSIARNVGIDKSRGDFITFIDADDWIQSKHIETLYKYSQSQLVIVGFQRCGNLSGFVGPEKTSIIYSLSELVTIWGDFNRNDTYYWFIWNKLFRKDVLINNKIKFKIKMRYLEDFCFVLDYFSCIDQFTLVNSYDYCHWYEPDKYFKYQMTFSEMKRHWKQNSDSILKVEKRCGTTFHKLRNSISIRHIKNFIKYLNWSARLLNTYYQVFLFLCYYKCGFFPDISIDEVDSLKKKPRLQKCFFRIKFLFF